MLEAHEESTLQVPLPWDDGQVGVSDGGWCGGRGAGSDEKAHVALEREQQTPIIVLNEGQLGLSFVWQMKGREVMLALQNRADQNKQQSTKILLETKMALS